MNNTVTTPAFYEPSSGIAPGGSPVEPLALGRRTLVIRPLPPEDMPDAVGLISFPPEVVIFVESPGTPPEPDRRAISARTAPSHLISSSSLGAHRRSVLFVVTILKVCASFDSSSDAGATTGGDATGAVMSAGFCRFAGRSYSSASSISANGKRRCGFVS